MPLSRARELAHQFFVDVDARWGKEWRCKTGNADNILGHKVWCVELGDLLEHLLTSPPDVVTVTSQPINLDVPGERPGTRCPDGKLCGGFCDKCRSLAQEISQPRTPCRNWCGQAFSIHNNPIEPAPMEAVWQRMPAGKIFRLSFKETYTLIPVYCREQCLDNAKYLAGR